MLATIKSLEIHAINLINKERYLKAEKLSEWNGAVYDDCLEKGNGEGFFESVQSYQEKLCDMLISGDIDTDSLPKFIWTCKSYPMILISARWIAEKATDDMNVDPNELKGLDELDRALNKFYEINKDCSDIEPDFTKAVLLDWTEWLKQVEVLFQKG